MNTRKSLLFAALSALVLLAGPAEAGDEIRGARANAMGQAISAHPADNSAITVNPGLLGLTERYDLAGHIALGPSGDLEWALTAMDGKTSPVSFGIGWRRTIIEPEIQLPDMPGWILPGETPSNVQRGHEFTVAVGMPTSQERRLSAGLNGTVRLRNDDRAGQFVTGNVDLGFGFRANEAWTFGLVAHDLLPLPDQSDLPVGVTLAARVADEELATWALEIDAQLEDANGRPIHVRTGGALLFGSARPRLGYRYDGPANQHWLTTGIGGENKSGAVEYSLQIPLKGHLLFQSVVHQLAVRVRT